MSITYDLIFRRGTIVNHDGIGEADIAVKDGLIVEIGDLSRADAAEIVDVKGLHVLPGVVDSQVHLREPGNEHKEDLESGGRAAAPLSIPKTSSACANAASWRCSAMSTRIMSGATPRPPFSAPRACCGWRARPASASMCCISRRRTKSRSSRTTRISRRWK